MYPLITVGVKLMFFCFFFIFQVSAICAALVDKNVLVQRGALDIISILFPFYQSFLLPSDVTCILTSALQTLLKRDVSLSRRFYAWLLGTQVHKSSLANSYVQPSSPATAVDSDSHFLAQNDLDMCSLSYFKKHSKMHLSLALGGIMAHAREAAKQNLPKTECILPYRLLRAFQERPEISALVMEDIMFELVTCLRVQVEGLGGVSTGKEGVLSSKPSSKTSSPFRDPRNLKKPGGRKGSLRADIIQSANLLFGSLSQDFVWGWMESMLRKCVAHMTSVAAAAAGSTEGTESQRGNEEDSLGMKHVSPKELRSFSPLSELLGSGLIARELPPGAALSVEEQIETNTDHSLDIKALLALFIFLMQVIPKVK